MSYSPHDGLSASIRVWSTDYESSTVGSGFLPTRLLMRAVFKVNPFCLQVLQLPPLGGGEAPWTDARVRAHQPSGAKVRFKDAATIVLQRENGTRVTLSL